MTVFDYIKAGGTDPDAVSALAAKLNRIAAGMNDHQHAEIRQHASGKSIDDLVRTLVSAVDDGNVETKARELNPGVTELTEQHLEAAEQTSARRNVALSRLVSARNCRRLASGSQTS